MIFVIKTYIYQCFDKPALGFDIHLGKKEELRNQKSKINNPKSEVGSRKSDVRSKR